MPGFTNRGLKMPANTNIFAAVFQTDVGDNIRDVFQSDVFQGGGYRLSQSESGGGGRERQIKHFLDNKRQEEIDASWAAQGRDGEIAREILKRWENGD